MTFLEMYEKYPDVFLSEIDDIHGSDLAKWLDAYPAEHAPGPFRNLDKARVQLETDLATDKIDDAHLDDPRHGQAAAINRENIPAFLKKQCD